MKRWIVGVIAAVMGLAACGTGNGAVVSKNPGGKGASPSGVSPSGHQAPSGTIVFELAIPGTDDHRLFTIGVDGSNQRQIRPTGCCAHLSVDGTEVLTTESTDDGRPTAAIVNLDGTGYRQLAIPDPTLWLSGDALSPDGTRVASEGPDDAEPGKSGIYTRRVPDGGDLVPVTVGPGGGGFPIAYSPDGSKILFLRGPSPDELPAYVTNPEEANMNLFVINADGTGLVRLNPRGTPTTLIDTPVWSAQSWSPDGRQVAFVASEGSFDSNPRSVWVVNVDGSDPHPVAASDYTAAWSPDGRWIAVDKSHLGSRDLFVVHPDGTGLAEVTSAADGAYSFGPVWSPESHWLLFTRGHGSDFSHTDLWIQSIDGTGLRQVTHTQGGPSNYGWSPT